jgi:hypothetical protein
VKDGFLMDALLIDFPIDFPLQKNDKDFCQQRQDARTLQV